MLRLYDYSLVWSLIETTGAGAARAMAQPWCIILGAFSCADIVYIFRGAFSVVDALVYTV